MSDSCPRVEAINASTFRAPGAFHGPIIWFYGERDPYYSIKRSRRNFEAFRNAGRTGDLHVFDVGAGSDGHMLLQNNPDLWRGPLTAFLNRLK